MLSTVATRNGASFSPATVTIPQYLMADEQLPILTGTIVYIKGILAIRPGATWMEWSILVTSIQVCEDPRKIPRDALGRLKIRFKHLACPMGPNGGLWVLDPKGGAHKSQFW